MEQWEYWTEFVAADVEGPGVREYLERDLADWQNPPRYIPQAMIPYLNTLGQQGWEMVHMQPVSIGVNYDVMIHEGSSSTRQWSNTYFCAFKRRLPG
jgi:hypothetical protein